MHKSNKFIKEYTKSKFEQKLHKLCTKLRKMLFKKTYIIKVSILVEWWEGGRELSIRQNRKEMISRNRYGTRWNERKNARKRRTMILGSGKFCSCGDAPNTKPRVCLRRFRFAASSTGKIAGKKASARVKKEDRDAAYDIFF